MARPRKFSGLLHELCVKYGHCGGRTHVRDLLPVEGQVTAEYFATLVLQAEEIDGTYSPKAYADQHRFIAELFVQHMGVRETDAAELA